MPAPVVVGADGSQPSDAGVIWAAEEAARRSLPLRIVYVCEPWAYGTPFYPVPGMADQFAETGRQILTPAAELAAARCPGLEIETRLIQGGVAHGLREQSADAFEVVVGHRGLGGFAGLLLGSVSLRVAGHTDCPVVVVRGEGFGERDEVVVGVDPEQVPTALLDYAFEAASLRGVQLRVVSAWQPSAAFLGSGVAVDLAEVERQQEATVAQTLTGWRERYPAVKVVQDTVRAHPVEVLAKASAEADLLVVGAGRSSGTRVGSVSHGVVHHAQCPVAIVPQGT